MPKNDPPVPEWDIDTPLVSYKGKTYYLLWEGRTKFGDKCKLQYPDGTGDFWANSREVRKIRQRKK